MSQRLLNTLQLPLRALVTSSIAIVAISVPLSATAQSDDSFAVEEIVVTATKRVASIQDVPLSVSALSGADLEDSVAFSFSDYAESVPGLSYNGNDPGNDKMIVRGISTDSFNGALQSTVGIYIDDMPGVDVFVPTSTPDLHMFDVNRVEVLRGPQGTLWGSSSLGGALRIVTNKPTVSQAEFRARVTAASVANGGTDYGVDAVGNIPLVEDTLALRVTGYTRTDAGYLDASNRGTEDANETTVTGGRASLRWFPSNNLVVDLTGTFQRIDADDRGAAWLNDPLDPAATATTSDPTTYAYIPESRDQSLAMGNLVLDYDFGNVNLVSSTTVGESELESVWDQTTNTSFPLIGPTGGTIFNSGFFNDDKSSTFSQEIRLVSDDPDSAMTWIVGAFYLDNDRDLRSYQGLLSNASLFPNPLLPGDVQFTQDIDNGRTEKAIFGEFTWHINDRWDATIGARYFENEQDFMTALEFAPFAPGFPSFVSGGSTTTSEDGINPKVSLAYRPSDDVMLYGLASKGFRLGGANQSALGAPFPLPEIYESDTVWNYELGARTVLNNGRTVLNATVFYVDWSDLQNTFRLEAPLPPIPFFVNAGSAHTQGIELELTTQLSEDWEFHTALTALEAEIDDPSSVVGAIATILPGEKLPGSPDFQASSWLSYAFQLGDRPTSIRVNHRFVGESNYNLGSTDVQGDYHVYGLSVNSDWSDTIRLSLYAKNLGNSDGITSTIPGIAPAGFADKRYVVRPRTIGLSLQVKF